jgi:hypothetical protein
MHAAVHNTFHLERHLAINAADRSGRSGERMAGCSRGRMIARPASGFFDRDWLI